MKKRSLFENVPNNDRGAEFLAMLKEFAPELKFKRRGRGPRKNGTQWRDLPISEAERFSIYPTNLNDVIARDSFPSGDELVAYWKGRAERAEARVEMSGYDWRTKAIEATNKLTKIQRILGPEFLDHFHK